VGSRLGALFGSVMLAFYAGLIFLLLKWLEVEPFASWTWWWVIAPLVVAFLWFEYFERLFGRDKRPLEMSEWERLRRRRIEKEFDVNVRKKSKRR